MLMLVEDKGTPQAPARPRFWDIATKALSEWATSEHPDIAGILRCGIRLNSTHDGPTFELSVVNHPVYRLAFTVSEAQDRITVTVSGRDQARASFSAEIVQPLPSTWYVRTMADAVEDVSFLQACVAGWCIGIAGEQRRQARPRPSLAEQLPTCHRVRLMTLVGA